MARGGHKWRVVVTVVATVGELPHACDESFQIVRKRVNCLSVTVTGGSFTPGLSLSFLTVNVILGQQRESLSYRIRYRTFL